MASTLLAIDDSVTMRKVLEITFAGQDFKVVTAPSGDAAMQKLASEKPDLVICDVTLEPKNGYDLCKAIKAASPSTPVLLLSSKQNPFDAAKGAASLCDEHMDKPFDTQQMIDKVKKILASPGATATAAAAPAAAAAPKPAVPAAPAAAAARPATMTGTPPTAPGAQTATGPAAVGGQTRAKTLIYSPGAVAAPPPATGQATPVAGVPLAAKPLATTTASPGGVPQAAPAAAKAPIGRDASPAPPPVAPVAAQVNGQMGAKLEQLGLTPAQVDAVLALSREVVERVVWEVVPVLAETIIKEEISRLTK